MNIFFTFIKYTRGLLLFIVTAIAFAIIFEAYRCVFKFIKEEYFDKALNYNCFISE
jgi:hypothetical protein